MILFPAEHVDDIWSSDSAVLNLTTAVIGTDIDASRAVDADHVSSIHVAYVVLQTNQIF